MTQVKINFWFILIRDCNDTGQNKFLVHIDQGDRDCNGQNKFLVHIDQGQ